jgi:dienelactone hydrolase
MSSFACCGGFIDQGTPKGSVSKLENIPCYIAPKEYIQNQKVAIILATDIFGFTLPNIRLIADSYAKEGKVLTVVPDFFEGIEVSPELLEVYNLFFHGKISIFKKIWYFFRMCWHGIPFILRASSQDGIHRVERIAALLRREYGIQKIAVQGYCWGGRIAMKLAHSKESGIDVISSAHPGGLRWPTDVTNIIQPSCFILPEKDPEVNAHRIQFIRDFFKHSQPAIPHVIKYYPGQMHGFAVRGDENNEEVRKARKDAFQISLSFFQNILHF